ncbi:MAG: universal stress protein [Promethearchaeota archaeon]|nr:MAG: universal stress protein [Candidatus Lokiarchaeota archaeon]
MNKIEFKSLLVPIEGSPKSYEAVDYALEIAKHYINCSITLCYVIEENILKPLAAYQGEDINILFEKYEEQGKIYFENAIKIAKKKGFDSNLFKTQIFRGDPGEEIIKFSTNFDLIVITVRAKLHSLENSIGKVTKYVLRMSKIPVFVVT